MNYFAQMRIAGAYLLEGWREANAQEGVVLPLTAATGVVSWCASAMKAIGMCSSYDTHMETGERGLWAARWAASGWPTLSLTDSLTAALLLTDCSTVDPELLKLPFDAFVIELPWPRSPLTVSSAAVDGSRQRAKWITVHKFQAATVVGAAPEDVVTIHLACPDDLAQLSVTRFWPRNVGLRAAGKPTHWWTDEDDDDDDAKLVDNLVDQDRVMIDTLLGLVANFCLYVAANHSPLPSQKPKSSTSSPRDGELPPPLRWVLGREIKLSAEVREAAAAYAVRGTAQKPWKLAARYVVRGHWRNQACGAGMLDRRMKWIAPYWKGPEEAPGLTRNFVVEQQTAKATP